MEASPIHPNYIPSNVTSTICLSVRYNVSRGTFALLPTRLTAATHGHSALVLDGVPRYCDSDGRRLVSAREAVREADRVFMPNGILWWK